VPDANLSSGRPVWQDFVHALVGIAGQGANFDANGHWNRLTEGTTSTVLSLGTLPGVGQLLGTTPAGGAPEGARPVWVGDLPNSVYRPDVLCTTQKVPSLASDTAAPLARSAGAGPKVPQSTVDKAAKLIRELKKKAGR
jgi:hypothetical protein